MSLMRFLPEWYKDSPELESMTRSRQFPFLRTELTVKLGVERGIVCLPALLAKFAALHANLKNSKHDCPSHGEKYWKSSLRRI